MSDSGYTDRLRPHHRKAFREDLADWFEDNSRELPWRAEDDRDRRNPYHVWLAEVMLQQTRVAQVESYFERFLDAFPTLEALAAADLDEVLLQWEGLGYYSRARNFHSAVREVSVHYNGSIPEDEKDFKALPGVGDYTAAAVLSLAFRRPLAAVDGNVVRVLTRVFGIEDDVTSGRTRRRLQELAAALLETRDPGRYNESVMELGATVCVPRNPKCGVCPLETCCVASARGTQNLYPVKSARPTIPHYDIAVAIITNDQGEILVQQRPLDAMLGGLWEFPGGKVEDGETPADAAVREAREELGLEIVLDGALPPFRHAYSHFRITMHGFEARRLAGEAVHHRGALIRWVSPSALDGFAFPRANRRLLEVLRNRPAGRTLSPQPTAQPE
jgi:A/G-specific adenine glycosylase